MGDRTFEQVLEEAQQASRVNDGKALLRHAAEFDALGTPLAFAWANNSRGWALHLQGDYPTSLECFRQAYALYEELGDVNSAAGSLCNIGNVLMSLGDPPAALEHFHRALDRCEEQGNQRFAANVLGGIGNVHYSTGDYPTALEHYHRALALHEELGNRSGLAMTTGNIGLLYTSTGDHTAALTYFQRALALHEQNGDRSGIAGVTSNIGLALNSLGDHEAALEHFQRALAINEELDDRSGVARVTGNILAVRVDSGSYAEAQQLLRVLDTLQIDEPSIRIGRELQRATLLEVASDVDGAIAALKRALTDAMAHELRLESSRVHKALRELALKQNDLAGYVEHNNSYTRITEEINGKDTATKLAMQAKQREIDAERKEAEKFLAVLHSTLPREVAERVARGEVVNDHFENATVIFLDIVGFTEISSALSSQEVISLLDDVFTQCDEICAKHGVTKIKTIGDSYMAVGFNVDGRASVVDSARCALEMSRIEYSIENRESMDKGLEFRVGLHCGPVTAGVIGKERMQYDVWGDTVNIASRMESTGLAGRCHITEAVANAIEYHAIENREYRIEERGMVDVKGKGMMRTFWLEGTWTR